ncbi:hypothetical protein GALMADRAFT_795012 [Galerina marginata CBS 339.88]|uniref:CHAT domain-containing protein n=1 Tax=Galerina marginata (strain CBS 339.88) TaxID=685588 RepID=A0A067SXZ9_GALM3|nr:hypothetical protein GALMADRAFT_795012 [Galerina marginata CBS 339.88]
MNVDKEEFTAILHGAAVAFLERYNLKEDLSDIGQAIHNLEIVVNNTGNDHQNKPERLNNLGIALRSRFEQAGDTIDIYKAISSHQQAIGLTPHGDEGNLSDIDDAVSSQEEALYLIPDGHEKTAEILNCLGNSLLSRFESTGDTIDVYQAIEFHQNANEITPDGHSDLPRWLNSLGLSLMRRFDSEGNPTDIDEAISSQRKAVCLTPEDHADMAGRLNNLGISLLSRFELTEAPTDINEAISSHQTAVRLTPHDHADMPMWMSSLGNSFMLRFKHTGDVNDISEAISWLGKAVHDTPPEHASMPTRLNNLGISFMDRFRYTGDIIDISQAISFLQKGVHLSHEDVFMPALLNNLGLSFLHRFRRTGDTTDVNEAVFCYQKAIRLCDGGLNVPMLLNNIGQLLLLRFERIGDLADVSQAITLQTRAVSLTPDEHASKPGRLGNLGGLLLRRFERTGDLTDISNAILSQQQSLVLAGVAPRPQFFNNLGNSFLCRFEAEGQLSDIGEAVSCHQRAINLTPDGHADMSMWLRSLGLSLRRRFERTNDPTDIQASIFSYRRCATYTSGSPSIRLDAAKAWAELAQKFDPSQLLEAHCTAIALVSQVAGLGQTVENRHNNLVDISDISACAAAAAFGAGRPELALEWLEQGRCLVWNQIISLRTSVDDLRTYDEALANRFSRVSMALEHYGAREAEIVGVEASMEHKVSLQQEAKIHAKLAHEMEQLLEQIRRIPKFRDFLRPPEAAHLLEHLPSSGNVILINVHQDRCDALALIPGRKIPLHIPLGTFTYGQAAELWTQLHDLLSSRGVRMPVRQSVTGVPSGSIIKRILKDLWLHVVKPIVDGLEITLAGPKHPHRIWWCTTGPLAFLPVHAAGNYSNPGQECVSDLVISSYTPTVTSLREKVKRTRKSSVKATQDLLMISQANAPNLPPIPGVTEEVKTIQEILRRKGLGFQCLEESVATLKRVTTEIEWHGSVHFACHGIQDPMEPLHSGFLLHDGQLKISELLQKNLPNADFAFLSACQTSAGSRVLSEEAVHLAGGMLAAGYQGVVATMWSIKDWYAPKVAENFYNFLLTRGALDERVRVGITNDGAAYALHDAIKVVRDDLKDSEDSFLLWLPYAHFGL